MPTDTHYEREQTVNEREYYEAKIYALKKKVNMTLSERDEAQADALAAWEREQRAQLENATLRRLLAAALAENRTWDSESAREADEMLGEGER